ncbi:hypothetical protein H0H81_002556 [Sphagnurus paluster]|uniref:Uncharacterized protein n=1 Tax=Sphagnurus paluster TaxID=117069 RepID=A0A9P7KKD9_9AGAR|nr:hypothetical protein H0H81_002556 [Sphagnurus paluster]
MSLTYTHPPPPAKTRQPEPATSSISSSTAPTERDPRVVPSFGSKTLTNLQAPIIYLPPLLSSLPDKYPSEPIASGHPPLLTEIRLPDIDRASLSLHKALFNFKPIDAEYVNKSYAEAFNWSSLMLPEEEEREWYCVVFRSKRRAGSDNRALYDADEMAHEEAVRNGGLILYWYGIPNPTTGMNMATCIWQSRNHAIAGTFRPAHAKAMRLAATSYEVYSLERHILRKQRGTHGVIVEPYLGGDVGW